MGDIFCLLVPDVNVNRLRRLATKTAKTVTNISKLSQIHFVSNIRHQHRCSRNWRWYSWRTWCIQYESCIEYLFNVHLADVWPLDAQLNAHKCSLIGFAWLNQTSWLRPDSKFIYKGRRAITQQKINKVRLHQYQKCDISKKNYGFSKKNCSSTNKCRASKVEIFEIFFSKFTLH